MLVVLVVQLRLVVLSPTVAVDERVPRWHVSTCLECVANAPTVCRLAKAVSRVSAESGTWLQSSLPVVDLMVIYTQQHEENPSDELMVRWVETAEMMPETQAF